VIVARIASSIVWLVCTCQVCPRHRLALCAGFFVGDFTLTVLAEPGLGWLGFRAEIGGQINTHQMNLS
jgi:hypothetical protein